MKYSNLAAVKENKGRKQCGRLDLMVESCTTLSAANNIALIVVVVVFAFHDDDVYLVLAL